MSKWFKNNTKKVSLNKEKAPRVMAEINKSYGEELARAGEAQYLVYVHTENLRVANQRLLGLNQEAAQRQQLDKAEATKAAATAETKAIKESEQTQGA